MRRGAHTRLRDLSVVGRPDCFEQRLTGRGIDELGGGKHADVTVGEPEIGAALDVLRRDATVSAAAMTGKVHLRAHQTKTRSEIRRGKIPPVTAKALACRVPLKSDRRTGEVPTD